MAAVTLEDGVKRGGVVIWVRRAFEKVFGGGRWISFLLLIGLIGVRYVDPGPVEFLRLKVFDVYQQIEPRSTAETQVVVADLDEESLAAIGQWPWSRSLVAKLVVGAMQKGALLVGFDVMFAEPDRLSPDRFADTIRETDPVLAEKLRSLGSTDAQFAAVLKESNAVLGQASGSTGDKPLPNAPSLAYIGQDPKPFLTNYPGMIPNTPVLEAAAGGRGLFIMNPEADNVVRRVPAVVAVQGKIFPTLSIEMLRVLAGVPTILIKSSPLGGVESLRLQGPEPVTIPTDPNGRLWPHYAKFVQERYISARTILDGTVDPKLIEGKLVLVGASAAGLRDLRTTPVDAQVPGVEAHAQLIESILNNALLTRPVWAEATELLTIGVIGVVMLLGFASVGARWTLVLFVAIVAALFVGSFELFSRDQILLDATAPAITALAIYVVTTYIGFTREEAQRRQIKSAFGFYLSPAMVDRLASDPDQLRLGGEDRDMTILFSDVRGFTTISEMFDAAGLTAFMNRYLTPMTDIAQANGAYIDKYIGDAIMAFWNAPLDDPKHASNACKTIMEMRDGLVVLNQELKAEAEANGTKFVKVNIGMGLNSGLCTVGNMGSNQKFNYSVLGDTVNLASRLEGQSKPYHLDNIIGEETRARAMEYAALEVDLIQVKGKTVPVRIFTLVGRPDVAVSPAFKAFEAEHNALLVLYRSQQWDAAEAAIAHLKQLAEPYDIAALYDTYLERIAEYRVNGPGADWDGVYVATSK